MMANQIGTQKPMYSIQSNRLNQSSSVEQKIERLKKSIQEVKENKNLSAESQEKREKQIQDQISRLEQQKISETPQITSKNVQVDSKNLSLNVNKRFDTFEHQPESQAVGVYELSHDEEGKPVIKFDDPSKETAEKAPATNSEDGEKPQIVKTTVNTDAVDREIEKLKRSLSETKQRLSSTSDPKEKELLNNKLSQLEAELKQKDSDTYRRQHGQITEQKVVSKIGE